MDSPSVTDSRLESRGGDFCHVIKMEREALLNFVREHKILTGEQADQGFPRRVNNAALMTESLRRLWYLYRPRSSASFWLISGRFLE